MRAFTETETEPLTDAELDRLGDLLEGCKGGSAMNVEELDGFFAALIAGPETVMPSEYYPEVFGGDVRGMRVRQPRRGERNFGADDAALEQHRRHPTTHGGWAVGRLPVFSVASAGQPQCPHERSVATLPRSGGTSRVRLVPARSTSDNKFLLPLIAIKSFCWGREHRQPLAHDTRTRI